MRAQKKGECQDEWRENVSKDKEREKKVVKCQHHQRSLTPSQWDGEASSHRDRMEISALLHSSTVRIACCYMFSFLN